MNAGAFDDPEVIHVDDSVDPIRDLEIITEELRLKVMILQEITRYYSCPYSIFCTGFVCYVWLI
jgi:hypothetical protein